MDKNLNVVIVAAGASKRFNNNIPKPFIMFEGRPIVWYSLFSFNKCEAVKNIYIVVSKDMQSYAGIIQKKYFNKINKFKEFIIGGKERQDSVYNALFKINSYDSDGYVAVHDAARPFIKQRIIENVYNACLKYGAGAPGIPLVDTIKGINEDNMITDHLNRRNMIAVQTPQIFKLSDLLKAYEKMKKLGKVFTDDTEIYSMMHKDIKIVEGDPDLFKLTFKNELKTVKLILSKNRSLWK